MTSDRKFQLVGSRDALEFGWSCGLRDQWMHSYLSSVPILPPDFRCCHAWQYANAFLFQPTSCLFSLPSERISERCEAGKKFLKFPPIFHQSMIWYCELWHYWHQNNHNCFFCVATEHLVLLKKHCIQNLQIETFRVQLKQTQIEVVGCPI